MSQEPDTYTAGAFCANCGYEGPVSAPLGEFVAAQPCPLCAVTMLRPAALRDWERSFDREPGA